MTAFARLHPALQHHVVNSLGWRTLRPFQERAIEPVIAGGDVLVLAPTAGGKTEAAMLPLLSRMLSEPWAGLSILYVCPIRALLNDLEPRLSRYCSLVGRSAARWHGDVGVAERRKIIRDPPDVLLTTPESLEAMLISRTRERAALLRNVRCVVVDEVHAFAGDDRGWHLLAVLDRVERLAGARVQRVGLSATVGEPERLLDWLSAGANASTLIAPPASPAEVTEAEVTLDYVGSVTNAAALMARLHRGEKRLVFCDSRAQCEELAGSLRALEVRTFVSHSSLATEERRAAEAAFRESSDCIIVATSTLELGIDVGDLDRVIQLDAPSTVASFLQRLGRTGRREGSARNSLLLALSRDGLVRAAGLLRAWHEGYVEPLTPPPAPLHILGQQLLALTLQHGRVGRALWPEELGGFQRGAAVSASTAGEVLEWMVGQGLLAEELGMLSMGPAGEKRFGRRHFLDLVSAFTSEPLLTVRHGRRELGRIDQVSLVTRDERKPTISLAGRPWSVLDVDWRRRVVQVEAIEETGRSRWLGQSRGLSAALARSIRSVLAEGEIGVRLTRRAQGEWAAARGDFDFVRDGRTALVDDGDGRRRWWTFAGGMGNAVLERALEADGTTVVSRDSLALSLAGRVSPGDLQAVARGVNHESAVNAAREAVDERAVEQLKFSACLPPRLAAHTLALRAVDTKSARSCGEEPCDISVGSAT